VIKYPYDITLFSFNQILASLGTENNRPSSAAQCVAYVAVAELPVGQWPELIEIMVSNVVSATSTEMMKEATLESIGYICQDIVSCLHLYNYFYVHLDLAWEE